MFTPWESRSVLSWELLPMGRYNHADTVRVSVRATLLLSDVASLMTLAMHVDNMLQRLKKFDERQIL